MHKHDKKRHRGADVRLKNANTRLPESVAEALVHLLDVPDSDEPDDWALQYLTQEYLSKYCDDTLVSSSMRRKAAVEKWLRTEDLNAFSNVRIANTDGGFNILPRVTLARFIEVARQSTRLILGPLTNKIVLGQFSGGASTSRRRTESQPAQKFTGMADVTEGAVPYVGVIHREVELFREHGIFYSLREVEGAVLFTVPKKTDIDRCACKEPDINMFLQKGVGKHVRRRLRKFGIFLNDQSVNRGLARKGSMEGHLATLDLSSASDTMTIELVRALLPTDWFLYLNDIRSQKVWVDGTLIETEMFSSMGNGFTFELESLLFYVLMRTVAYFTDQRGSVISVYGDDIIIPVGMYDQALFVLSFFGFSANESKSFHTGPFRESCGGHYLLGEDVTPFYLKKRPTHLTDLIRILNQLRRWLVSEDVGWRHLVHGGLVQKWIDLAKHVPSDLWGGCDYAVDTQLVTPHYPVNALQRLRDPVIITELGRYMAWHNQNWARTNAPREVDHPASLTHNTCRRRRTRPGALVHVDRFEIEWS